MPDRRPNLIIAGVRKAGTTSLYTWLAQHPDFFASSIKETSFFQYTYGTKPQRPFEEYLRYFADATDQKYVFEATPGYINGGKKLADLLDQNFPDMRIIIIVREQGDMCRSNFTYQKSQLRLPESVTFSDYVDESLRQDRERELWKDIERPYRAVRDCRYEKQLPHWIAVFGSRLKVVFFDDLKRDPADFTDQLCDWLGVRRASSVGVKFVVENKSIQPRHRAIHGVALRLNKAFEKFWRRNMGLKRALRYAYFSINSGAKPSSPQAADMARLREAFVDSNRQLRQLLVRHEPTIRLPSWLDGPT